ncbi:hypothetical protein LC048_00715 [Mesobacillus subterraneus]|uniref:hypothetical protein n=1 Tax=Mesobacillus subterraneus TaxID=285983 RepID=UPI001CFCF8FA|nr:hypothetical protein [Mesobacillus subterraneus]WLR55576.1 hypothetical protein LC048_00715 [Mesobacillus subterraneus]
MYLKKFFRRLFLRKYDEFATILGFQDLNSAYDNTFFIFRIPEDAQWNATELPNKSCAVWNDIGQPPYSFQLFPSWEEAIVVLRNTFEQENYDEDYWEPEGFEPGENVFTKPPDKNKRDY